MNKTKNKNVRLKTKALVKKTEDNISSGILYTLRNDSKLNLLKSRLREHPFTLSIINNSFDNAAYYTYLSNIIMVYSVIEDRFLSLPVFKEKGLSLSEEYKFLFRTPRIYEDIMSYKATISPYVKHHNPCFYVYNWIQNMRMRNPQLLVCEFFIRYLGDLHGSTALCSKLRFCQTYAFREIPEKIKIVENLVSIACKEFSPSEIQSVMINSYSSHLNFLSGLQADFINDQPN